MLSGLHDLGCVAAQWTFLGYMMADNNLECYIMQDVLVGWESAVARHPPALPQNASHSQSQLM